MFWLYGHMVHLCPKAWKNLVQNTAIMQGFPLQNDCQQLPPSPPALGTGNAAVSRILLYKRLFQGPNFLNTWAVLILAANYRNSLSLVHVFLSIQRTLGKWQKIYSVLICDVASEKSCNRNRWNVFTYYYAQSTSQLCSNRREMQSLL